MQKYDFVISRRQKYTFFYISSIRNEKNSNKNTNFLRIHFVKQKRAGTKRYPPKIVFLKKITCPASSR